jgi:hypothetical protein
MSEYYVKKLAKSVRRLTRDRSPGGLARSRGSASTRSENAAQSLKATPHLGGPCRLPADVGTLPGASSRATQPSDPRNRDLSVHRLVRPFRTLHVSRRRKIRSSEDALLGCQAHDVHDQPAATAEGAHGSGNGNWRQMAVRRLPVALTGSQSQCERLGVISMPGGQTDRATRGRDMSGAGRSGSGGAGASTASS